MINVQRKVAYTQAYGCLFCLHVGGTAIYFGRRVGYGARLELLTQRHWFRWSWLVVLLLATAGGCRPSPGPMARRAAWKPDTRTEVAGWMAYYTACKPKAPPAPKVETPKPVPKVVPKPAAPAKPKAELNVFGLPVGTAPKP